MLISTKSFLLKKKTKFIKISSQYEIFDADTNSIVGLLSEDISITTKILRLFLSKLNLRNKLIIYDEETSHHIAFIKISSSYVSSKLEVFDGDGEPIGYFMAKIGSIGNGFYIFDNANKEIAIIKPDRKGFNFQILSNSGQEFGTIKKIWAGFMREFFTSIDNYSININDYDEFEDSNIILIIASCFSIIAVYKQKDL